MPTDQEQPFDLFLDLDAHDLLDLRAEQLDTGTAYGSWGSFGTFGSAWGCASSVSTGSCVS